MKCFIFFQVIMFMFSKLSAQVHYAHIAADQGMISLKGESTNGYIEAKIYLENKTAFDLTIDFSKTSFLPLNEYGTLSKCQRIGLTQVKDKYTYIINIKSHEYICILFNSRCLDKDREAPKTGQKLLYISMEIPDCISIILRRNASQNEVWEATDGTCKVKWKSMDTRNQIGYIRTNRDEKKQRTQSNSNYIRTERE